MITKKAGTLEAGDGFRLPSKPGQVFRFRALRENHVEAFGGSRDPSGNRQFRAFRIEEVVEDAYKAVYPDKRRK